MIHIVIGLISFAAIFGGALTGLFVRRRLPGHHLSSETQSVVTVSVAVIGTLSALVLGLMISAANSSFSKRSDEVRELSLQLIRMDRNLRRGFNESALEQEMTLGRRDYVGSNFNRADIRRGSQRSETAVPACFEPGSLRRPGRKRCGA
jgi:hypothetical protein